MLRGSAPTSTSRKMRVRLVEAALPGEREAEADERAHVRGSLAEHLPVQVDCARSRSPCQRGSSRARPPPAPTRGRGRAPAPARRSPRAGGRSCRSTTPRSRCTPASPPCAAPDRRASCEPRPAVRRRTRARARSRRRPPAPDARRPRRPVAASGEPVADRRQSATAHQQPLPQRDQQPDERDDEQLLDEQGALDCGVGARSS